MTSSPKICPSFSEGPINKQIHQCAKSRLANKDWPPLDPAENSLFVRACVRVRACVYSGSWSPYQDGPEAYLLRNAGCLAAEDGNKIQNNKWELSTEMQNFLSNNGTVWPVDHKNVLTHKNPQKVSQRERTWNRHIPILRICKK